MSNLLDYFGAVYLINLPERKDRLKSAAKELARVGWSLGPEAVQLYAAQRFTERAGFPGNASVRGAFHSHTECIRAAYNSGKRSVLLLEDDIALASSIHYRTPSIISQLDSTPWDFLYLGHEATGDIATANSHVAEIKLLLIKTEIRCAHFYAINGRIFERLLAHLDRVAAGTEGDQQYGPMPVDGAFNVFRRNNPDVHTWIASPKLGWQRPSRSDISPQPMDSVNSLRPFLKTLRNVKYAISRWRS